MICINSFDYPVWKQLTFSPTLAHSALAATQDGLASLWLRETFHQMVAHVAHWLTAGF